MVTYSLIFLFYILKHYNDMINQAMFEWKSYLKQLLKVGFFNSTIAYEYILPYWCNHVCVAVKKNG